MRRISPAPPVHQGTHWLIEHAYPVGLLGWMVIVLRRHAAALHELTPAEFRELGELLAALVPLLRELCEAEKEYVSCFAEGEGFRHVHFHVVAVRPELPRHLRGAGSMALLTVQESGAVPAAEVRQLCATLRTRMERDLRPHPCR